MYFSHQIILLSFNMSKCKIMHLGKKNMKEQYLMQGTVLEATSAETDIGVMIQDNLKPSTHCAKTAAKANGVLGQLRRAVFYRESSTFMRMYLVYVRPVLEYFIQAVGPHS